MGNQQQHQSDSGGEYAGEDRGQHGDENQPIAEGLQRQSATLTSFNGGQYNQCSFNVATGTVANTYNNNTRPSQSARHTDRDLDQLRGLLTKHAKEESGKMSSPINLQLARAIEQVPLQMTSNMDRSLEHLDEEGHYSKRKDFEVILKSRRGDITLEQLFKQARKEAEQQAKLVCTTKEAKTKYIQRHANMVTLLGQAGIGKTTLARKMINLILNGKLCKDSKYVFFIQIRKLNFEDKVTFMQFALIGCSGEWDYNPESDKFFFNKLCKNDSKIVFIFDGLDEANTDQLSKDIAAVLFSKKKPDVFLRKILSGELFPNSKKVVTSRPRQFFELHPNNRPGYVVNILGLDEEGCSQLCQQVSGDNYTQVKLYLVEHPDVSASCYVPVKCIIIVVVLSKNMHEDGDIDIQSLTDVFVQALGYYVRSPHVGASANEVWKLSHLAWNGFSEKKIIFDERDFQSAGISSKAFGTFLETFVDSSVGLRYSILYGDKKSSFSHLVWQELFAAINLMMFMPVSEFENNLVNIRGSSWEVVAVFMFGLCNQTVMKRAARVLSKLDDGRDWKEKKKMLIDLLLRYISSVGHDTAKLLQVCAWIQEAKCDEINDAVLPHLPERILLGSATILPSDASNITYVLRNVHQPYQLEFDGVQFVQDSFIRLCKGLSELPHKMKELNFSMTTISNDDASTLTNCLQSTETLDMGKCTFQKDGIAIIATKAAALDQPMKKLNFSGSDIGDEGAIALASCLHNVEELYLWGCKITKAGIKVIAEKLKTCDKPMKKLNLNFNNIGDDGAFELADCLHNIEMLELLCCNIKSEGVIAISQKLSTFCQPMKELNLSHNDIGESGAAALQQCLDKVGVLHVKACGIEIPGTSDLVESIDASPTCE